MFLRTNSRRTSPPSVSEFQVKEASYSAAPGQQDKPSPDSGCSLGFNSTLSSPRRPAGDSKTKNDEMISDAFTVFIFCFLRPPDTESTLTLCGNSSDPESEMKEEGEEEGQGGGDLGTPRRVPEASDQEAFLKENFVTLADLSASGLMAPLVNFLLVLVNNCQFTTDQINQRF